MGDLGPADNLLPIRRGPPMAEGRIREEIIGVFELFLGRERFLDEVCVEAA